MAIGTLSAFISSFSWPILTVICGELIDIFVKFENSWTKLNETDTNNVKADDDKHDITAKEFMKDVYIWSGFLFGCYLFMCLANYLMMTFFPLAALNQIHTIKVKYFESVLRQDIAWFDTKSSGDFASRVSAYDNNYYSFTFCYRFNVYAQGFETIRRRSQRETGFGHLLCLSRPHQFGLRLHLWLETNFCCAGDHSFHCFRHWNHEQSQYTINFSNVS